MTIAAMVTSPSHFSRNGVAAPRRVTKLTLYQHVAEVLCDVAADCGPRGSPT